LAFNLARLAVEAALGGDGLAFVLEPTVEDAIADGRLIRVLGDWCPPFSGYHLYYPSRRELSPALALLIHILRYPRSGAAR
jgi:DNA-binding transcriptional LysR family regulator